MIKDREKVMLLAVHSDPAENITYSMEELSQLVQACDLDVAGEAVQNLPRPHSGHYVGAGKARELALYIAEREIDLVVVGDELSNMQIRNLEKLLDCTVIDRTQLILHIFARRARSREAKLQVELAELQYMLPRLVGMRASLSRQGGGSSLRNRGAGETKLELDRRHIEQRIYALKRELEDITKQRQVRRKRREKNGSPVVALVGYTNTGKSTIMNALVERFHPGEAKEVFEQDMLFATLDTSVRHIKLPDNKTFLLTDTVGFVSKLPHQLVKAFRSTLEEVISADLLIHVADCSHAEHALMMEVTRETLNAIGIGDIPTLYVYNKCDLTDVLYPTVQKDTIFLSARQRIGIEELAAVIREKLFQDYWRGTLFIPYSHTELVPYLNANATIQSIAYEEEGTVLDLELSPSDHARFEEFVVDF